MRNETRSRLFNQYIHEGFEDDDDLDFYLQEFLGLFIPRKSYCPHHDAPFSFLSDVYFERALFVLAFGSRSSGKTTLVSVLNHLDTMYKGKVDITSAGSTLDQSGKGYKYFQETFEDPLVNPYLLNSIQSHSETWNGSTLDIVAGTMKGLNGPHPQKARFDEVELMDWNVLQEGLSMSVSNQRVQAQDVLSSTRKKTHGVMNRLLREAEEKQMRVYNFCIWDVVEKCTRQCQDDPVYGNCPIYDKCQGKAHDGSGWFRIDDLIKKVLVLSVDTFQTQWENKRPSDAPTVYGDYWNEDMHVLSWRKGGQYRSFREVFGEDEIPKEWKRVGGIDFGSRFCFLMIAIEPHRDIWVVYHEYWCDYDRLLKDHASNIKASPGYRIRMPIFADPAGKQDRIELRKHGIRTWAAIKDVDLGVDAVKQKLQKNPVDGFPRLFVMSGCKRLIYEMGSWGHGVNDDGTVDRDVFLDYDDDASDALRYPVFSYRRVKPASRVTTLDGV